MEDPTGAIYSDDKISVQFSIEKFGAAGGSVPNLRGIIKSIEAFYYDPIVSGIEFDSESGILFYDVTMRESKTNSIERLTSFRKLTADMKNAIESNGTGEATLLDITRIFTKWGKTPAGDIDPNTQGPGIVETLQNSVSYAVDSAGKFLRDGLGIDFQKLGIAAILAITGLIFMIYFVRRFV